MPELPEVETVRRTLASAITGATIERVAFESFTGCIAGMEPDAFAAGVTGRRIVRLGRRAKLVLIHLDSDEVITVHLRMTGELSIAEPGKPYPLHHHLSFVLDDGRELRFRDTRKFGRIRLLNPALFSAFDATLGPEPFDPALTADRFHAMLANRRRAVKTLLLEQSFLAGVGNIYADEALFTAGIHPMRAACSLDREETADLLAAIRDTMGSAIERGGTTIRDYRDGLGRSGTNQRYLSIYTLAAGEPCPVCTAPIERIVVGQRGTKFCPQCQPFEPAPATNTPRPPRPEHSDLPD